MGKGGWKLVDEYSVHNEEGFERVYDDDEMVQVRRGDLQGLLDLATGSLDFGSGFWDNEQVEIARKIAGVLGVDMNLVTPSNFVCQYKGEHIYAKGEAYNWVQERWGPKAKYCLICRHVEDASPMGWKVREDG